jgi:polysaccharide biosynthesis protein PelA
MKPASLHRRDLLLASAMCSASHAITPAAAQGAFVARNLPRSVYALYDGGVEAELRSSFIHRCVAMPLEWLGLVPRYHDIRQGLPNPLDPDVLGAVTCFPEPSLQDITAFAGWTEQMIGSGRRLVILGDLGAKPGAVTDAVAEAGRRRVFMALGLRPQGVWQPVTLGDRIVHQEPRAGIGFEHGFDGAPLPPFELWEPAQDDLRGWLVVERAIGRRRSHVISVSPRGGFVASGYLFGIHQSTGLRRWRFDPFAFLDAALGLGDLPRPDTTTLCGRRVHYSHIDGDAWQSISQVRAPGGARATNGEIIHHRVIAPNPDLPVTVAPIAVELDPARKGDARTVGSARALFALPQVEVATHTYTHPFSWSFYANYDPARERPFEAVWQRMALDPGGWGSLNASPASREAAGGPPAYVVPRAYGDRPFNLAEEVTGSAALMQRLAPAGKRCTLLQWSGDCSPFPAAIHATDAAGLANINGGDTRCDDDHPSVTAVAPTGLPLPNGPVQIYASNSNENTYTELWSNRFFGFRDLPITWARTEAPRRLKPTNLYYHMYSGERLASLNALLSNIATLRQTPFIGVATSRFAQSAMGFYKARIEQVGPTAWRVRERGGLATLRFAGAATRMLDLTASQGVLGESIANGDLYIALDPHDPAPVVALVPRRQQPPPRPQLRDANWEVSAFALQGAGFAFTARGWGEGQMRWQVPRPGPWRVAGPNWQGDAAMAQDLLQMRIPAIAVNGVRLTAMPA